MSRAPKCHVKCLACGLEERNVSGERFSELLKEKECSGHRLHDLEWHDTRLCGDTHNTEWCDEVATPEVP